MIHFADKTRRRTDLEIDFAKQFASEKEWEINDFA